MYIINIDTPRNFIIAKFSIRKPGSSSVLISDIISADKDEGLRIESLAIIKSVVYIIQSINYNNVCVYLLNVKYSHLCALY